MVHIIKYSIECIILILPIFTIWENVTGSLIWKKNFRSVDRLFWYTSYLPFLIKKAGFSVFFSKNLTGHYSGRRARSRLLAPLTDSILVDTHYCMWEGLWTTRLALVCVETRNPKLISSDLYDSIITVFFNV